MSDPTKPPPLWELALWMVGGVTLIFATISGLMEVRERARSKQEPAPTYDLGPTSSGSVTAVWSNEADTGCYYHRSANELVVMIDGETVATLPTPDGGWDAEWCRAQVQAHRGQP